MTPIQSKRIAKVVQVLASLKTASSEWEDIATGAAKAFAESEYSTALYNASHPEGDADEYDVHLSREPRDTDISSSVDDELINQVAAVIEKNYDLDAILADYKAYAEVTDSGNFPTVAEKYGWYFAMQNAGEGVGLGDDGFESSLDNEHVLEHYGSFLQKNTEEDTIMFNISGTGIDWVTDVTYDVQEFLID